MRSFLMIAAAGAALAFLIPSGAAKAADRHFGGAHGSVGGHHGGGNSTFGHGYRGAHGFSGGHAYPSYRAATPRHGSIHRGYTPSYHGGHYAPSYQSYRPAYRSHGNGGLHLDIGPLHLRAGGHHAR